MQGTMPGACRQGTPHTAWMDINTWTGLPVEESVRMTDERDEWRKYVHGVANPRIKDGLRQNRTPYSSYFQPVSTLLACTLVNKCFSF